MYKKLLTLFCLLILICAPSCRKKNVSEKRSEKIAKKQRHAHNH